MRSASPLLRWLSLSGVDAVGRVLLQIGGTVLFARLLGAESFGLSALVIVYVVAVSTLVTGLFEEALARQLRVRKIHFSAALSAVLALAAALYCGVLLLAALFASAGGTTGEVLYFAQCYALILFADGPLSIYVAVARRLRRFPDIALGNLLGLAAGTATGLALALAGSGVWGLLAVSFVARFVNLSIVAIRSPVRILPSRRLAPVRPLLRFGGWNLGTRYVMSAGEAVFQSLVTRLFGVEGNGFLNMAMRIVEPVRGATGALAHNIAMAYLTRLQEDPARLSGAVQRTIAESALILQPVFIGLAVTSPLIIEVIAGPSWSASAPIATLTALAAAVASAAGFIHNGLLAKGRAEIGFGFSLVHMTLATVCVAFFAPLGAIAIGLGRLAPRLMDAGGGLLVARRVYGLPAGSILRSLGVTSVCTALMAGAVLIAIAASAALMPLPRLIVAILVGMLVYGASIAVFQRDTVRSAVGRLWRRSSTAVAAES